MKLFIDQFFEKCLSFHHNPKSILRESQDNKINYLITCTEKMKKGPKTDVALPFTLLRNWLVSHLFDDEEEKGKVYKIANIFGDHLLKGASLDIESKYLKTQTTTNPPYYIEFPHSVPFPSSAVFLYLVNIPCPKCKDHEVKALNFLVPQSEDSTIQQSLDEYEPIGLSLETGTIIFHSEDSTIQQSLDEYEPTGPASTTQQSSIKEILKYALKCLLYIQSGKPDLEPQYVKMPETKNPKKLKIWHKNNSLFDAIAVGYSFDKPKEYWKGKSLVRMHTRWQRYGEGLSKVKLIWIDPFPRKYKRIKEGGDPDATY